MQIARRLLVASCLLSLTAVGASAFKFDIHAEITDETLRRVGRDLPRALRTALQSVGVAGGSGLLATGFSDQALQEVVDANKATDTGDCGDKGADDPAEPCKSFILRSEGKAALDYLAEEPAADHFDNEAIEVSSNQIFTTRGEISRDITNEHFTAARKAIGHALHGIQDFYSHTNYVELPHSGIERRIGTQAGFSDTRIAPQLATKMARGETCLNGATLMTAYLTSGYFFTPSDEVLLTPTPLGIVPGFGDIPEITKLGKCRHGWTLSDPLYGASIHTQPGINKDDPSRPGFYAARQLAADHTYDFVMGIIDEFKDRPKLVAGLLGYEITPVIETFRLGIPGAPNGESWDTAIRSVFTFNLKNIQPDISVCVQSSKVPYTCLATCEDADWSNELNGYVCTQSVPQGRVVVADTDLRVLVREVDFGLPKRTIAVFDVKDPRRCDPFCTLELEKDRSVWIEFKFAPSTSARPRVDPLAPDMIPTADRLPVAKPSSTASNTPTPAPGGGAPGSAPPNTTAVASAATSSTTALGLASSSSAAAPGTPAAPVAPGSATAFSTSSPAASATPGAAAPRPAAARPAAVAAAAPARSVEGISARLQLRDASNCTGADSFYPSISAATASTLGRGVSPAQANQLYQMAAVSVSVSDPAAKKSVLDAIRSKVGDDAFFSVMTAVITDPAQSRTLLGAYQNTAQNVARQIASSGLTSLMPTPLPPSAIQANVDQWVVLKLSSPTLASSAIAMMSSGATSLSAECTINELAKEGFTDTVLGR